MKSITSLLVALAILSPNLSGYSQKMTNKKLINHLENECDSISGDNGKWQLFYHGIVIIAMTNNDSDRIKRLSPITYTKDVETTVINECLQANFDNLKDVKYAIANNIIWSVYDRDFSSLSTKQIDNAMLQIYYSTGTFGEEYSSSIVSIAENSVE